MGMNDRKREEQDWRTSPGGFRILVHCTTTLQAMALVTIVGFPCCGKSTRAKQIKEYLEKRIADETDGPILSVVLVDDDNSHVPRSTYDSMSSLHFHHGRLS